MDDKLYWLGNVAKTKIIRTILAETPAHRPILIFDYGCGKGGDWPAILGDYPNIKLVGYEPYYKSYEIARKSLQGLNAEIYTGDDIASLDFKADYVVSFSVLEHVFDRRLYLATIKRLLAGDGTFFLNYDDGHFRNFLNLNRPDLWFGQLKEWLHNFVAVPLSKVGIEARFQRRVFRCELESLVKEMGFRVVRSEYSNLVSFKDLQKTMASDVQQDFSAFWIQVEEELNSRFHLEQLAVLGDTANLWRQMGSKTLYLRMAQEGVD
jgi:SAM-dependent methyltransferase